MRYSLIALDQANKISENHHLSDGREVSSCVFHHVLLKYAPIWTQSPPNLGNGLGNLSLGQAPKLQRICFQDQLDCCSKMMHILETLKTSRDLKYIDTLQSSPPPSLLAVVLSSLSWTTEFLVLIMLRQHNSPFSFSWIPTASVMWPGPIV